MAFLSLSQVEVAVNENKHSKGQTLFHFGGTGTPLHLAIANGFPAQTYQTMLHPLLSSYEAFSWLPRALWRPTPPPASAPTWKSMTDDLLAALAQQGCSDLVGVGHSMGGVVTLIAAVTQPHLFRGIVLLDPVFLPPSLLWSMRIARFFGKKQVVPLSRMALKRRKSFASREEALLYWQSRPLFANWPKQVLTHYVEGMLVPDESGEGFRLAWAPEWEAHYYETIDVHIWRYVRKVPASLPVLLVRGSQTDTLLPAAVVRLRRILPHLDFVQVEGHGHLFPQSAPEVTGQIIQNWLQTKEFS